MMIAIKQISPATIKEAIRAYTLVSVRYDHEAILVDAAHILEVMLGGPLREVHEAIHVAGPHRVYHREVLARHREEWPTLWEPLLALDSLIQEVSDSGVVSL